MNFNSVVEKSKKYFPNLTIKFKNESLLMKILALLLFFNKDFSTKFITTIGNNIYFPSQTFVNILGLNSIAILMHEFVHIYDSKKYSNLLFRFLYLFPQSLIIFTPLLFLISWQWFIVGFILCLLPFPAYFRMKFEMRAYLVSLYVYYNLGNKLNFDPKLDKHRKFIIETFKDSSYYFMYPFNSVNNQIDKGITLILLNKRPYEDKIFDIIDDIMELK